MTDRLKTALSGAVIGFTGALIIFLYFRDADAGTRDNLLLLTLTPLGGFAGGWRGYPSINDESGMRKAVALMLRFAIGPLIPTRLGIISGSVG